MAFFTDLDAALDALRSLYGDAAKAGEIPAATTVLTDAEVLVVIAHATTIARCAESLRIAASGVAAARSRVAVGHVGLAQQQGHRTAVSLIQELTGSSRSDAAKHVRLGQALHDALPIGAAAAEADDRVPVESPATRPWHAELGDALMHGRVSAAQHDAIQRGLGEPPVNPFDTSDVTSAIIAAWRSASEQLIAEADVRTVEELASAARTIRDLLDPSGAEQRFADRADARSFRTWTDREGTRHGSFVFDDEGGAWVDMIIATALRPRRGGPRFVEAREKENAENLTADARTNDQLAYDLMLDVLRAGALAEPEAVFGTRQAGLRVVVTAESLVDTATGRPAVALAEDGGSALPAWLAARVVCDVGTMSVLREGVGTPLDLGRTARLFSTKQRLALAMRDGGCRMPGCDRPPSYCEAHHIDPFSEGGRTDLDRGVLLCRFHHMNLHHHGWRIVLDDDAGFALLRPGEPPLPLPPRLSRRYAFGDLRPPPRRFRPAAA